VVVTDSAEEQFLAAHPHVDRRETQDRKPLVAGRFCVKSLSAGRPTGTAAASTRICVRPASR
jgi:hypothetical protein